MKHGVPKRPVIAFYMGLILLLLLLAEVWLTSRVEGGSPSTIWLLCLFLFVLLVTFLLFRSQRAGTVKLFREGLSIPVGFRPLFLEWNTIQEIKEIVFKGKPYVGIKLKGLDEQRKAIQYLAKVNEEHTGYHLVLGSRFFDEPLRSMAALLAHYAGDENVREDLPPRSPVS